MRTTVSSEQTAAGRGAPLISAHEAACGSCALPAHCALNDLKLLPPTALEDAEGLARFLKTVRPPNRTEQIASALRKQAGLIAPTVTERCETEISTLANTHHD